MPDPLSLLAVSKRFVAGVPGCRLETTALRDVTLRAGRGEIIGVAGPPGAGKTTLLLCAAGLLRPDRGVVRWLGAPAPAAGSISVEYVGSCPQSCSGSRDGHRRLWGAGRVSEGSGELAHALRGDPRLVLLDDAPDYARRGGLAGLPSLLRYLGREGATVLVAARQPDLLIGLVDRLVLLVAGSVSGQRRGTRLMSRRELEIHTVDAARALAQLAPLLSGVRVHGARDRGRVRVALDEASPEAVLAVCRDSGIPVVRSRVVAGRGRGSTVRPAGHAPIG